MTGKGEPDCVNCMPQLMPENEDAIQVWAMTRDQVLTAGMSGEVYALNHGAVWKYMDEYGIPRRTECFEKVLILFGHFLEKSRDEAKLKGNA